MVPQLLLGRASHAGTTNREGAFADVGRCYNTRHTAYIVFHLVGERNGRLVRAFSSDLCAAISGLESVSLPSLPVHPFLESSCADRTQRNLLPSRVCKLFSVCFRCQHARTEAQRCYSYPYLSRIVQELVGTYCFTRRSFVVLDRDYSTDFCGQRRRDQREFKFIQDCAQWACSHANNMENTRRGT